MNNGSFYKDSGGYPNYAAKRRAKQRAKEEGGGGITFGQFALVMIVVIFVLSVVGK